MLNCTPFLLFDGNCAEAMTSYQKCLALPLRVPHLVEICYTRRG
jgi:PhnB protein